MAIDLSNEINLATTPSQVVNFDKNTPTTSGVVFTPDTPTTTDILYVSSSNASTWIYNGSAYVTYTAPAQTQTTPFYLKGTTIDAQSNKTANIQRDGSLTMSGGFYGPGVGLTGLNASNISSGTLATARMGSGTANSTTYLRGDNTWATVSAGGLTKFTEAESTTTPNATIYVDSLTASASSTNADISIIPKGAGAFQLAIPDSTTAGGNKRGQYAVDLQIFSRSAVTQVASGAASFASGGRNTASGNYSTAMGSGNIASDTYSVAIGYVNTASNGAGLALGSTNISSGAYGIAIGLQNTASNTYSVAIGYANTASGVGSSALGFNNTASAFGASTLNGGNVASGNYSLATGLNSSTFGIYTKFSHGSIQFTSQGDNQLGELIISASTTGNTATTLTSDRSTASTTNQLILQNQQLIRFKGTVMGKQQTSTNVGVWEVDGVIVRGANAGTTTLVISNVNLVTNASGWGTPTLTADTTNGGLQVQVTGLTATNIKWNCRLDTIELINA